MEVRLERDHGNSYVDVVVSVAGASDALSNLVHEWHASVMDAFRTKAPGLEVACCALCYHCLAHGRLQACTFPIKLDTGREDGGARGQRRDEELEDDSVWCWWSCEQPEELKPARLLGNAAADSDSSRFVPPAATTTDGTGKAAKITREKLEVDGTERVFDDFDAYIDSSRLILPAALTADDIGKTAKITRDRLGVDGTERDVAWNVHVPSRKSDSSRMVLEM